jgi:hypothetical protein
LQKQLGYYGPYIQDYEEEMSQEKEKRAVKIKKQKVYNTKLSMLVKRHHKKKTNCKNVSASANFSKRQ